MLSASPSFWDSTLEAPASGLGPAFAATEAPPFGDVHATADVGLQYVASLHQSDHAGQLSLVEPACRSGPDDLPLDESLFDLEVPELEDVDFPLDVCGLSNPAPLYQQLFDEIPALEDVPDDEVNWPSWVSEPAPATVSSALTPPASVSPAVSPKVESEGDPCVAGSTQPASPAAAPVAAPSLLFDDDCLSVNVYEEEVQASSPVDIGLPGYVDKVGCASPASVYSLACSTISSGIGGSSPLSAGFASSDDLAAMSPAEKRRRASQVSVSSFCSSVGGLDSVGSPGSTASGAASDSDHCSGSKRGGTGSGGRRSRFSAEDRKERKKAQNRTAAERYRQKRRQAEETVSEEEQQLMDANGALRIEATKLEAELSCLRRLMLEMLRAKGIEVPAPPPKKKSKTA